MTSRPWDYWFIQTKCRGEWVNHHNDYGTDAFVLAANEHEALRETPVRFRELKGREVRVFGPY